jgi:predicted nucleic acid-binding protein
MNGKVSAKKAFVDTNIIVYAFDPSMDDKYVSAKLLLGDLVESGSLNISTQVLREFSNVYLKNITGRDANSLVEFIDSNLKQHVCIGETVDSVKNAVVLTVKEGVSFYDGLILQSAIDLGCDVLYSEDFQHDRIYSGVKVINPFI